MALYSGTDFNDLSNLLFKCLTTTNPTFNRFAYFEQFNEIANNLDRVDFVYKDIKKYPKVFAKFMKDAKDDATATRHIENAKVKFNAANYWGALEDFTRCISAAQNTQLLALTYGHRAECFVNLKMRNHCLIEIRRAVSHNYPQELREKLFQIKNDAELLESNDGNDCEPITTQAAADCITIEKDVVATRDIDIGEIISIEHPFTSVLTSERLQHCHHCLSLCHNLIPCKHCTVALFCDDVCADKAQPYHKYECPILLTVCYRAFCEFALDHSLLLALKVAIVAKDDYASERYKEIDAITTDASFSAYDLFHHAVITALVFELLWNQTSFFTGMFTSPDTKDKFKQVMMKHLETSAMNAAKIYEYSLKSDYAGTNNFGMGLYLFFSILPHSCCANVMKSYHGNVMVLRALNTIKKGERCFVNRYSLRYDACPKLQRSQFFFKFSLPECRCRACEEDWEANLGDSEEICADLGISTQELGDIVRNVIGSDVNEAKSLLPSLIEKLRECEDGEPMGNALALKNLIVHCYVVFGNKNLQCDQSLTEAFPQL